MPVIATSAGISRFNLSPLTERGEGQILTLHKPTLSPPVSLSEYRLIRAIDHLHEVGASMLEVHALVLEAYQERLKTLDAEKIKAAAERVQWSDSWSVLSKVANYILTAISAVFGVALVVTGAGPVVGAAMVAAAILAAANLACIETGIWDLVAEKLAHDNKERQKQIAQLIPAALGLVSGAINLLGSGGAVLWANLEMPAQIYLIASTALGFAQGATTAGTAVVKARNLESEATLLSIKKESTLLQDQLDTSLREYQAFAKQISSVEQQCNTMIALSIAAQKQLGR